MNVHKHKNSNEIRFILLISLKKIFMVSHELYENFKIHTFFFHMIISYIPMKSNELINLICKFSSDTLSKYILNISKFKRSIQAELL